MSPSLSHFLLGALAVGIQQYTERYRKIDLANTLTEIAPDLSLPKIETFDFIVVGGGTAGCLVAERLSNFFTVLLLEAGGNPPPVVGNPFFNVRLIPFPEINNIYPIVQQKHYLLSTGGFINVSQGRMMGGSGSHNDNIYNRGSPQDYNYFANVTGDEGWSYTRILEQFIKFENFVGWLVNENERNVFYATGGLLNVVTAPFSPLVDAWFKAGKELGFPIGDPNGYQTESFTPMSFSMKNGERSSTYSSFIEPLESSRANLKVLRYSEVQQILINDDLVAYGVSYKRHGIPQIKHGLKGIIISAGPILSPILLMKSGIGPRKQLEQAGIPVLVDLPGVGEGLMDHVGALVEFNPSDPEAAERLMPTAVSTSQIEKELISFQSTPRTGLFTQTYGPQGYLVSSRAKKEGEENWPDVQLFFTKDFAPGDNNTKFPISVILTRPKSRGWVRLDTDAYRRGERDDTKIVLINPASLTVPSDVDVMAKAFKFVLQFPKTLAFRGLGLQFISDDDKVCKKWGYGSDQYLRCLVQQRSVICLHFSGTCIMGRDEDPLAVVDSRFRVRGIENLRVVDSSIMPTSTNTNTNAPSAVVGQKGACDILKEHLHPSRHHLLHNICP